MAVSTAGNRSVCLYMQHFVCVYISSNVNSTKAILHYSDISFTHTKLSLSQQFFSADMGSYVDTDIRSLFVMMIYFSIFLKSTKE